MIDRDRPSSTLGHIESGGQARSPEDVRYLKGRIPICWLAGAARLPGRSLHVGLAIWYAAGLQKSHVVPLSNIAARTFGLDRNAKYRALAWLEQAGLVSIERKRGRPPIITLLDREGGS